MYTHMHTTIYIIMCTYITVREFQGIMKKLLTLTLVNGQRKQISNLFLYDEILAMIKESKEIDEGEFEDKDGIAWFTS